MDEVKQLIRAIPDFPQPGILFRDITPVLSHPVAFSRVIDAMAALAKLHAPTRIVGIESRGFILGAPIAVQLGLPFAPVRKPGKLPHRTYKVEYALEYGSGSLEMHVDAVERGDRVIVVDDLLATGGTAEAACRLVEAQGAEAVAVLVMIELAALAGAERLAPRAMHALLRY